MADRPGVDLDSLELFRQEGLGGLIDRAVIPELEAHVDEPVPGEAVDLVLLTRPVCRLGGDGR